MNKKNITGIQQMGVGVADVHVAWKWYRQNFGIDIGVFEEEAVAELMLPYTEGKKRSRHAVLAYNMQAGGGFEIWQHTGKTPEKPTFEITLGDLGIFIAKLKSKDVQKAYDFMKSRGLNLLSEVVKSPNNKPHFFVKDPFDNIFQIVENAYIFEETPAKTGGIFGAIIGVSAIDESLKVYRDILEYDVVVYDKTGVFEDLSELPGGTKKVRRILLKHSAKRDRKSVV